jgi:hypothetical protein
VAGQIATAYYFAHFLIILPILGIIDNVLSSVGIYTGCKGLTNSFQQEKKNN